MIGWIKWMDKIVFIEEWEAGFFFHCPWNPFEPICNLHHLNRWIHISFNSHNGTLCVVFIGNWWSKNGATKCWMSARFIRANWIKEISNLTLNSLSSFKKTQIFEHFIWSCYELSVQSDSVSGLSTLTICSNGLVIVTMWVLFLLYVNRSGVEVWGRRSISSVTETFPTQSHFTDNTCNM